MPDDVRERITACQDLTLLDAWMHLAFSVEAIDELFGEPTP